MDDPSDLERLHEAQQYKLQAEFILHKLQANNQVYGTNSAWTAADPADVPLALKYIDRSLEHFPDNATFLNLKALLLIEGGVDREAGMRLMERAAELAPRDITIQDNLEKLRASASSQCFVATAAYGSWTAEEVGDLRSWRDDRLLRTAAGRRLVRIYYRVSPPLAGLIADSAVLRGMVRLALRPLVSRLRRSRP